MHIELDWEYFNHDSVHIVHHSKPSVSTLLILLLLVAQFDVNLSMYCRCVCTFGRLIPKGYTLRNGTDSENILLNGIIK